MSNFRFRVALSFAVALAMLPAGRGLAQESTAATYEDWVVRCAVQAGPPSQKICGVEQLTQVKGQTNPLSRVAITRPTKGQPIRLVVQLPVNVWLPAGAKVQISDKEAGPSAAFTRCIPSGCFAEIDLNDDFLKRYRVATEPAKIVFKNGSQQDTAIPVSPKGFARAFDAMLKE